MLIREERAEDHPAITAVTEQAFASHPFSHQTEPFIIHALRRAGALTLSLVAEVDGKVVGHIAFSPVTLSSGATGWVGLGPVSVLPARQRQGIGSALINEGLGLLKAMGKQGCVLVGEPDFYRRFGFRHYPELTFAGAPPEVFLALVFSGPPPQGTVTFHEGFGATG